MVGLPTISIAAGSNPARFGINTAYVWALANAGAAPVLIPLTADDEILRPIYDRLDAIVFPGGMDVAPERYAESRQPDINDVDELRDSVELKLAHWALADELPVLGICRGQQLINVAQGGTLYQDLRLDHATERDHSGKGRPRNELSHRVRLDPGSRLAQLIDETDFAVNSLHHQAVKDVGSGLRVTGRSDDNVIEAMESDDGRFLITVQWHPEELTDLDWAKRLFSGFVRAASTQR